MNKLYLLAALAASTFAAVTTEDADECSLDMTEEEDGDYAYSWITEISIATLSSWDETVDSTNAGALCYYDFIYNFSVDDVSCADADSACTYVPDDGVDFGVYGYAADGSDEDDVDFESLEVSEATIYADWAADVTAEEEMTDPYDGGIIELGSEIMTTSEKNKDAEPGAAGFRVAFIAMVGDAVADAEAGGVVTVEGMSNNAVVQAAGAFTLAAVAGLFF